jgi:prepilin-type N-terminal cleavage/methylation domain-containing protein
MSARRACGRRGREGFTLLEVLASVAILGIVFTLLSGVAARWLGAEGEARRRMQAALLADQALADLEAEVVAGRVPPVGENEETDPDELYQIVKRVADLPLPAELCERLGPKSGSVGGAKSSATLCPTKAGGATYLRTLEVAVSWEETGQPVEISRKTVAFDLAAAKPILETIPRPESGTGGGAGAAGEDENSDRDVDARSPQQVDRNRGPNREGRQRGPNQPDVAPNSQTDGDQE